MTHVCRWVLLSTRPRVWRCDGWPGCKAMRFEHDELYAGTSR